MLERVFVIFQDALGPAHRRDQPWLPGADRDRQGRREHPSALLDAPCPRVGLDEIRSERTQPGHRRDGSPMQLFQLGFKCPNRFSRGAEAQREHPESVTSRRRRDPPLSEPTLGLLDDVAASTLVTQEGQDPSQETEPIDLVDRPRSLNERQAVLDCAERLPESTRSDLRDRHEVERIEDELLRSHRPRRHERSVRGVVGRFVAKAKQRVGALGKQRRIRFGAVDRDAEPGLSRVVISTGPREGVAEANHRLLKVDAAHRRSELHRALSGGDGAVRTRHCQCDLRRLDEEDRRARRIAIGSSVRLRLEGRQCLRCRAQRQEGSCSGAAGLLMHCPTYAWPDARKSRVSSDFIRLACF